MSVRVRFAPSPTGKQHLGGLRSAVFNYLFARSQGGTFILRIEDTDQARFVEGSVEDLTESLNWLGITPDEGVYMDKDGSIKERGDFGPYTQSKRLEIYKKYAEQLVSEGKAYRCFATAAELEDMRKQQQAMGLPPRYDRRFRDYPAEEVQKRLDTGEPYVIRQAMPLGGEIVVHDVVRGDVTFQCSELDDHVLLKADGFPTYQLANVVDDHLMEITHVLRAEEWLPSAPKNALLYQAFGWEPPVWVHLPQVLGEDKSKLSKRHGAEPILVYRDRGYLPEALMNVLAFLGWNPGTEEEFFTPDELAKRFTLERIQKAGAVLSPDRLDYVNGVYIRKMPVGDIAEHMKPYLAEAGISACSPRADLSDAEYLLTVAGLLQDRFKHFDETKEFSWFFFTAPVANAQLKELVVPKRATWEEVRPILSQSTAVLSDLPADEWTLEGLEKSLINFAQSHDYKNGIVLWPIRAALTGESASPGSFEMLAALGKEESLKRLQAVLT